MTRGNRFTTLVALIVSLWSAGFDFVAAEEVPQNRAERALLHRQEWDFPEIGFQAFSEVIARQFRIPVVVDFAALQDEGIDPLGPLQPPRGTMTLNKLLDLSLQPFLCAHSVDEGVLIITTQAKADEILTTRIYPVLDLVRYDDVDDYASLTTVIQEATSGQWEMIDGVGGTMTPLPATGSLVIRQTWKVHSEIESLLSAVRKTRRLQQMPALTGEFNGMTSILHGRRVIFGDELIPDTGNVPEPNPTPAVTITAKPANWQVPRVDRPRGRKP